LLLIATKKKKNATWDKKMLATATSNFENFPPYKNGYQVASTIGKGQSRTAICIQKPDFKKK
jgi:hypothetical protein